MMLNSIESRTIKVIAEELTGRADTADLIKPEDHLFKKLRCDSLELIEISVGLQKEFGIEIKDSDMAEFTTVQQIIDHVANVCTKQQVAA
jgi:acyl carrier protein